MKYLANVTTLKYAPEKCTGCRRCVEVCPHGVFEKLNGTVRLADAASCMECGACQMNCAPGAIHVETGVGCAGAMMRAALTGRKEALCG